MSDLETKLGDRDAVLAAIKPREETFELGGVKLVVREMATAAESLALTDGEEVSLKLTVRCTFFASDGTPVFSDEDLPELRNSGRAKFFPLLDAVRRVNGFDTEDNEKKSVPQPSE